jgi:hypothetical protein
MRTASKTSATITSTIGMIRSYKTLDGTRGVCLRVEAADDLGFSDWPMLGLLIDWIGAPPNGIEIVRPPANLSIEPAYSEIRRVRQSCFLQMARGSLGPCAREMPISGYAATHRNLWEACQCERTLSRQAQGELRPHRHQELLPIELK